MHDLMREESVQISQPYCHFPGTEWKLVLSGFRYTYDACFQCLTFDEEDNPFFSNYAVIPDIYLRSEDVQCVHYGVLVMLSTYYVVEAQVDMNFIGNLAINSDDRLELKDIHV